MDMRKPKETTTRFSIPQWCPFTAQEGMKEKPMRACWYSFNNVICQSIRIDLFVFNCTTIDKVFYCPFIDIATVIKRTTNDPQSFINSIAEEATFWVNNRMISYDSYSCGSTDCNCYCILLGRTNTNI